MYRKAPIILYSYWQSEANSWRLFSPSSLMLVRQSRKSEFYFRCVQKSSFFYFDYKEKVESNWITKVQIGNMMRGSIQDRIYSNEEYIWNRERKRSRQLFVWLLGWPPAGVHSLWTMCSTSLWPKWRTRLDWLDSFNMEVRLSVSHLALAHLSFRMAFVQKKKRFINWVIARTFTWARNLIICYFFLEFLVYICYHQRDSKSFISTFRFALVIYHLFRPGRREETQIQLDGCCSYFCMRGLPSPSRS